MRRYLLAATIAFSACAPSSAWKVRDSHGWPVQTYNATASSWRQCSQTAPRAEPVTVALCGENRAYLPDRGNPAAGTGDMPPLKVSYLTTSTPRRR
jgi:hypothetical protein